MFNNHPSTADMNAFGINQYGTNVPPQPAAQPPVPGNYNQLPPEVRNLIMNQNPETRVLLTRADPVAQQLDRDNATRGQRGRVDDILDGMAHTQAWANNQVDDIKRS